MNHDFLLCTTPRHRDRLKITISGWKCTFRCSVCINRTIGWICFQRQNLPTIITAMISLIFPLFSLFSHSAPFLCFCYTPLHHRPTIHRFSSILSIAIVHHTSRLCCVDRCDLIAYMKHIRRMTCTDAIETHSRQHTSHNSTPPGFHM